MATYPCPDIERLSKGAEPCSARIVAVKVDSPAYDAGFEPGCLITSVDGQAVRDIIDWRWLTAEDEIELGYIDLDGEAGTVTLWREPGEDWGFEFHGVIFDEVRLCRNACTFCFMRQLPGDMRPSLSMRDDDFRLSFLSGTFVTLTNLTPEDEQRIVEQRISPLRVSLHAADPDVRRRMIGKHADWGLSALDRLLEAGIEVHAQIVLVPGSNDGEVLRKTLDWAYARSGILNVGIVPLGYTKYQDVFDHSFNEPSASQRVLQDIQPVQQRAMEERGLSWVYAADEFYRNAYAEGLLENLPPAEHYGDFSMFEDGIGIIRSYVDDWDETARNGLIGRCTDLLREKGLQVRFVVGHAMQPFFDQLCEQQGIGDVFLPITVANEFFGGNVDVTGLLCGCDIAQAMRELRSDMGTFVVMPSVILNDDHITLDGMTVEDVRKAAGHDLHVVSCNPSNYMREIIELVSAG